MSAQPYIRLDITGLDAARREIAGYPQKLQNVLRRHSVLRQVGTLMVASAVRTIDTGGRPDFYKPLAESTRAAKLKKYHKESHILVAGGQLRQSLDYDVAGGQLYLTSQDYLKYHQWEENRTTAMPARPVWGVLPEDRDEIGEIIVDELKK